MRTLIALVLCSSLFAASAGAQEPAKPFEPVSGQAGKDVVWVPSPPDMVNKMMEMANVTAADFVIDLGSGDGRNVIAAAKRGARALGVEYNPDLVVYSRRAAAAAGVAEKATFVQGDMYEADISQASALILFLLAGDARAVGRRARAVRGPPANTSTCPWDGRARGSSTAAAALLGRRRRSGRHRGWR